MNIYHLFYKYNRVCKDNNITQAQSYIAAPELGGDNAKLKELGIKKSKPVYGIIKVSEEISIITHNNSKDIDSITLTAFIHKLAEREAVAVSIELLNAIAMTIDSFTDTEREERNNIIKKLNIYKVAQGRVSRGGYIYETKISLGVITIQITKQD